MTDLLHPGAWWLWALALAAAASHTTNPLLLGLIVAIAALVVAACRTGAPWAVSFRWYLVAAGIVVGMRVLFRILTAGDGPTVLFRLPRIDLPAAAGITLLGPVSAEALAAGFYDGLRLATMIVCVGAANALANPKRLLAAVPAALYELGTVLVVSVSVFPQLAEAVVRVRRAQALRRGPRTRRHLLRTVVVPVLTDALDRSLLLAASMDSRGYGRSGAASTGARRLTTAFLLAGVAGLGVGAYGLLDATSPAILGLPLIGLGVLLGAIGFRLAGSRVHRTRYRPEAWGGGEWLVTGCGIIAAAGVFTGAVSALYPTANPLVWPTLPLLPTVALLVAAMPALGPLTATRAVRP